MKKGILIIAVGFISLLLMLCLAGCGGDTLKASYYSSRDQISSLDDSSEESPGKPETNCSTLNPHPLAEGMAEQFEVSYEEIMTWYCDGYAFSDILLALETEQLVDQPARDLLNLLQTHTWEEIWIDLGVDQN